MSIEDFIKNLTKEELENINKEFAKKENKKPIYQYSKIRDIDLRKIFDIEENLNKEIFNEWFNNNLIPDEIREFLKEIIVENDGLIKSYNEEDLKMKFLAPLLNKIKFKSLENKFRDFYKVLLSYETDDFIINGTTDFVVSKGLTYSKKPYFFIQEFKKGKRNSDPEPQLLAELISAVESNDWDTIKGAYIVGENWNFVILEKLAKNKYQFFVSKTFNCMNLGDLIGIYNNLLFVKSEIIEMIKSEDKL